MLIVPSIDLLDGKVVRLSKGDYSTPTIYNEDSLKQAKIFEQNGFNHLHIIDLLGAKNGRINIHEELIGISRNTDLNLQFGGGVRNFNDMDQLILMGVNKVVLGSLTMKNKPMFEQFIEDYGIDRFIIAVDVNEYHIAIKGWTEQTKIHVFDHINYCLDLGIDTFLCTDIGRDGLLNGPNFELYKEIKTEFPGIKLFASGGVRDIEDLYELKEMEMHGAIVGRAIYENKIDLEELSEFAGEEDNSVS